MRATKPLTAALLLLAAAAGSAYAQQGPGEAGWNDNGRPEAIDKTNAKTRAEVKAELAQARRDGSLMESGDASLTLSAAYPNRYPAATAVYTAKTRAEVKTELAEARRSGDVLVGDSSLTLREEFPQRYRAAVPTTPSVAQGNSAAEGGAR